MVTAQGRLRVPDPDRVSRGAPGLGACARRLRPVRRSRTRPATPATCKGSRAGLEARPARAAATAPTLELGDFRRIALFGGIYSNYLALEAALAIARARGVEQVFALGDFGAFGPHPDRTLEILRGAQLPAIQGNYEESLASGAEDCHCGYTDPRDNHFAQLSYDYTRERTHAEHKRWMGTLPGQIRLSVGGQRALLCHGSPRRINEFLWSSTTPEPFLSKLLDEHDTDLVFCTHTGLHWQRFVAPGPRHRQLRRAGPAGERRRTNVWFAIVEADGRGGVSAEFVPVPYDHERLAREMESERPARRVRRDDPHRLVDELPRGPAGEGARAGATEGRKSGRPGEKQIERLRGRHLAGNGSALPGIDTAAIARTALRADRSRPGAVLRPTDLVARDEPLHWESGFLSVDDDGRSRCSTARTAAVSR